MKKKDKKQVVMNERITSPQAAEGQAQAEGDVKNAAESASGGCCNADIIIDFAYCLPDNNLNDLFFIFGWFKLEAGMRLVALDGANANPVLLQTSSWRRSDIENLYGVCLNPDQAGHGFASLFALPPQMEPVANLFVASGNNVLPHTAIKPKKVSSVAHLVRELEKLPFPPGELERTLAQFSGLLHDRYQADRMRNRAGELPGGYLGKKPKDPKLSVIVRAGLNLDTLFTHALCLSEEPGLAEHMEIIYALPSGMAAERFVSKLEEVHAITGAPLGWRACPPGQGVAFYNNAGAQNATGEYLLFMPDSVFPGRPGLLRKMLAYLAGEPTWGAVGAGLLSVTGYCLEPRLIYHKHAASGEWNRRYPINGLDMDAIGLDVAVDASALESNFLLMRRDDFLACGGFNHDWQTQEYADWDMGMRIKKLGKKMVFLPHVCAVMAANGESVEVDASVDLCKVLEKRKFAQAWEAELVKAQPH